MTIELIKATDCRTRLHNTINNNSTDKKGIELINKEDCSSIKNSCARIRKKTKRELGHAIRNGDIPIPEDDRRYTCKYYNKQTKSCSEYQVIRCSYCKKNRVVKDNSYGWAHSQE